MTTKKGEPEKVKTCFFVAPIGDEGDEVRKWSDEVLDVIVRPAASEFGYKVVRADEIKSATKMITTQVIQMCINADLLVADLSGHNPNVFYELAIRHAVGKPFIQMIQQGESIPFDIKPVRTVTYDKTSPKKFVECCKELKEFIEDIQQNPGLVENPITVAAGAQTLASSKNPLEQIADEIVSALGSINGQLSDLRRHYARIPDSRMGPMYLFEGEKPRLAASEAMVLNVLQNSSAKLGMKELVKVTGLSSLQVRRVLVNLRRYGLIIIEAGSFRLTPSGRALDTSHFASDDLSGTGKEP